MKRPRMLLRKESLLNSVIMLKSRASDQRPLPPQTRSMPKLPRASVTCLSG